MTIVAGFRSDQGIVLCADTEETVNNLSKRQVPKLRFEPSGYSGARMILGGNHSDLAVAFCAATNNGPFVDEIVEKAWEDAQTATTLDEACDAIKQSIKDSFKEFGQIYQPGYLPEAELIYGIKAAGGSRLFYAYGPAINEKTDYVAGGIGAYMADFLARRMYRRTLKIRQCIILAAYILFQAKEHVSGCGGESHIAALRNDGTSGMVDSQHVTSITKLLEHADTTVGDILMRYANLSMTDEEFLKSTGEMLAKLGSVRGHEREKLGNWEELMEKLFHSRGHDELGLPAGEEQDTDDNS